MPKNENKDLAPIEASPEGEEQKPKLTVVEASAGIITSQHQIISFRNRAMWQSREGFPHFVPMTKELFRRVAYPLLGGVSRSRIDDVYAFVENTAPDFTGNEDLVLFGLEDYSDGEFADQGFYHADAETRLWDGAALDWSDADPAQAIWRSPYAPIEPKGRIKFIMDLANGDEGVYDDIMQSIAPIIMKKKPDGVIWWVGDGANGKSTLMDALYRIFPGQFASLTVKTLTDGRDTIHLNGNLANVVKESSEGRVEDTEIYKAIGTHENFTTHKFHSQETATVRGNMHHIFSANNIPTFNDKGFSARRRTFIIPFNATFESDPLFEQKTFTAQLFGELIFEMCRYAQRIEKQGFVYKWSGLTMGAKAEYDADANNAEVYAGHLVDEGVVAFDSFAPVKIDYENWCAEQGMVPLGVTNMRRAIQAFGFERMSARLGGRVAKIWRLPIAKAPGELQELGMGRPGMYTIPGFKAVVEDPPVPEFKEPKLEAETVGDDETPEEKRTSILNGRW